MNADAGWIICTARGSVMPSLCARTRRHAIGKWERAFGLSWAKRTRGRRIGWRCVKVRAEGGLTTKLSDPAHWTLGLKLRREAGFAEAHG